MGDEVTGADPPGTGAVDEATDALGAPSAGASGGTGRAAGHAEGGTGAPCVGSGTAGG